VTKIDNGANEAARASSSSYSVGRLRVGVYRADFGNTDITKCSWSATPSVDAGLPTGMEVRTALDTTDATRLVVRTYSSAGNLVESGFQSQVFCSRPPIDQRRGRSSRDS
jgi:hypothetical protein